jgi:hypothetical protein
MRENVRDRDRLEHIVEAANNILALSPRQISRYTGLPEEEIEDL